MYFSLSVPGISYPDFSYHWHALSLKHAYDSWTISSYSEDYKQIIEILELTQLKEGTWVNIDSGISLKVFENKKKGKDEFNVDDMVEVDIDIPLETEIEDQEIGCAGCLLSFEKEAKNLNITFALNKKQCEIMDLRPIDSARDAIIVDEEIIGCVWKDIQIDNPYTALHGMANTTAHPYIFYPVWPALDCNNSERLLHFWETSKDTEFVSYLDEENENHKFEFVGIDQKSLGALLYGLSTAVEELFSEAYEEDVHMYLYHHEETESMLDEEVVEEIQNLQPILACALFFGSRLARSQYLKHSNYNISLNNKLSKKELAMFVDGMIAKRRIGLDICDDERLTRVQSVNNRLSLVTGNIFYNELQDHDWNILDTDEIWGWMCWAFDLGVKYQMLRLDKENISDWVKYEKSKNDFDEEFMQELMDFPDEEE